MPSGDAHRQWFPEMIEMLRQRWIPEPSWDDLALLAEQLDTMLHRIRKDRNIIPPMVTCPKCGAHGQARFNGITINATILAAGRFEVASQHEVKELSKRWGRYRKEHSLDHYGKGTMTTTASEPAISCTAIINSSIK
jgi:hypothetical protein